MNPITIRTPPLRIHLIRHGETEWSLSGRHTGVTDIALTARGEGEARELARRLAEIPFARVLTSPRQRARRTGELVLPDRIPEFEINPDLAEWDYGGFEGQRTADILRTRPDWNLFRDGGPNGESPAQVSDRADRLIARLRTLTGNIALFTHGHFGRVLAARWIGLPVERGQHFQLGTASLSILGYDPHHLEVPVIVLWNATAPVESAYAAKPAIERWENEGGEVLADPREPGSSAPVSNRSPSAGD